MRYLRYPWLLGACLVASAPGADEFQLGVREDGVYRLTWEHLAAQGLEEPLATAQLALTNRGKPVAVRIDDGGDSTFGPGDTLDFVGTHLAGESGYYSEHSPWNVYRLSTSGEPGAGARLSRDSSAHGAAISAEVRVHWRLEPNRIRVRFNVNFAPENPEIWYWQRLSVLDPEPFALALPESLRTAALDDASLRIGLRGWSTPADTGDLFQHRVDVLAGDRVIGSGTWNGQEEHVIEFDGLSWHPGEEPLALRVPRRPLADGSGDIVDVSLLNWIEVETPFQPVAGAAQRRLEIPDGGVLPDLGQDVELFSDERWVAPVDAAQDLAVEPGEWWLVRDNAFREPGWVREDRPSRLRAEARQADYLMIAHASLLDAVAPLADLHRQRGLEVALIDVQDVFDEFNHGVVHPRAIRDFIAHADMHWQKPAPRFVLLVGDASWDSFNAQPDDRLYADWTFQQRERRQFGKNSSTSYDEQLSRNLVPAWSVATHAGYAAGDNGFVAIRGDDNKPDLAIGRLPVATPDEVTAIVDKIETYLEHSEPGPWRRNTLWIASEDPMYQFSTDRMVDLPVLDGFDVQRVYPKASEPDNAAHQQSILGAFDEGNALVHFVGHGGRYIWRTGSPDPRKSRDLFTLDHLDQLAPSRQLPLVLSMTCYSAPFDHPTADSIGEKFLRLPGRGAIAVLAASWRNNPAAGFSHALIAELMADATMGEAIMRAKQYMHDPLLVETYNLLGDPALTLAVPRGRMELRRTAGGVTGRLPDAPDSGSVLVDFVGMEGRVIGQREASFSEQRFEVEVPVELVGNVRAVRAYAWNAPERYDAVGEIVFDG